MSVYMYAYVCVHRNTTRCIKVVCRGGNENICHLNFIIRRHNAQHLSIEHKVATATTAAQQQNTFKIFNTISAYGTFYNNQQRTMCGTSTFLLCTVLMLLFVLGLNEWRHSICTRATTTTTTEYPKIEKLLLLLNIWQTMMANAECRKINPRKGWRKHTQPQNPWGFNNQPTEVCVRVCVRCCCHSLYCVVISRVQ